MPYKTKHQEFISNITRTTTKQTSTYLITAKDVENPHTFLNFISTYGTLNG